MEWIMLSGRLISVQPHPRLKLMKLIISLFFFAICTLFFVVPKVEAAETLNFVHQDHLGSTSLVTESTGKVVSKQTYYPYGSARTSNGTLFTDRAYTGQVSDEYQTGLYFYNARYYDPKIAGFLQADRSNNNVNRYQYVRGNPINYIDPSGFSMVKSNLLVDSKIRLKIIGPKLVGREEIEEKDLSRIALAIFSETDNAAAPASVLELLSWIFINRFLDPNLPVYSQGLGILLTNWQSQLDPYYKEEYIRPEMSTGDLADRALELCYQNSKNCPRMNQRYMVAYEMVKEVYESYSFGKEDPTEGAVYFAHDDKLERTNPIDGSIVKFKDMNQLVSWHQVNLDYMRDKLTNFSGGISQIYDQVWGNLKSKATFLIYGNDPCVWSSTCGYDRPYANRPDKLKLIQTEFAGFTSN